MAKRYRERRRVFDVRWRKSQRLWTITEKGLLYDLWTDKAYAVRLGAQKCRQIQKEGGLAQLRVFNKNGKISKGGHGERTYGRDPKRSRG